MIEKNMLQRKLAIRKEEHIGQHILDFGQQRLGLCDQRISGNILQGSYKKIRKEMGDVANVAKNTWRTT